MLGMRGWSNGLDGEEDYYYKNNSSFNTKVSDYTQELRSSLIQKFACFSAHILIHRKKKGFCCIVFKESVCQKILIRTCSEASFRFAANLYTIHREVVNLQARDLATEPTSIARLASNHNRVISCQTKTEASNLPLDYG